MSNNSPLYCVKLEVKWDDKVMIFGVLCRGSFFVYGLLDRGFKAA